MTTVIGEINGINAESLISSVSGIDLNSLTKQTLYTVPSGKTFIPTRIITRNVSTSLTTVIFGFGFDASSIDVVAAALHTALTGSTLYSVDIPILGSKVGSAAAVFGIKCSLAQGGAATATIDTFGYLF